MGNFGFKHLSGLAWLGILITILLIVLLSCRKRFNKDEDFDCAVIRYTAYFMWAWEIIKTIRMINASDYGPIGYYPLWMAPFHLCSMGLFVYLIIGSKKPGKFSDWLKPFGFAVMLLATSLILAIPEGSGVLGSVNNWSFVYDNILPFQSFLYHGCLVFVPLYMILSGFYKPVWTDILKAVTVLAVTACFSQSLNFIFDGSGADFMMLRYGNGSPFVGLLTTSPILYYVVMGSIAIAGTAAIICITILIRMLLDKIEIQKNKK